MTAWRILKFSCNTSALTAKHFAPVGSMSDFRKHPRARIYREAGDPSFVGVRLRGPLTCFDEVLALRLATVALSFGRFARGTTPLAFAVFA
jgi:hypothetical protein